METKRFKPLIDKLYWWILIPTAVLLIAATVISVGSLFALIVMLCADLSTVYFLISPLVGYVELRESSCFVRFGFFMTREIPYSKIRGIEKTRKFYADSMMSLKNSMDHVNIKYNKFDLVSVSVVDNEEFIRELEKRR